MRTRPKKNTAAGGVRELMVIALPMMVSQGAETAMLFTDRLFLSRLSPTHMAAAMGGGITAFMFMTFFIGLTGYVTALVAQYLGAARFRQCSRAVFQGLLIALLAWPLLIFLIPVGQQLFSIMGHDSLHLQLESAYFRILMWGSGLSLVRSALSGFWSGIGRTRVIMISALVCMGVNVSMNWILIFGRFGFPAMGIEGAAIGTIVGNVAGILTFLFAFIPLWRDNVYDIHQGLKFDRDIMTRLWRFGYPGGLEFFLNVLAFNLIILLFHGYGSNAAAAVTIAFNWDLVSFIPLIGVSIAVTSLVGRYMGSRQPDIAHRVTLSGLKIVTFYTVLIVMLYLAFSPQMVALFLTGTEDAEDIAPMAIFMVRLVCLYVMGDGLTLVFSGALKGAGDTFWTMVISVSTHWLLVGITFLFIRILHMSPEHSWIAVVVFVWTICVALFLRYRSGRWRHIRVVDSSIPIHDPAEIAGL